MRQMKNSICFCHKNPISPQISLLGAQCDRLSSLRGTLCKLRLVQPTSSESNNLSPLSGYENEEQRKYISTLSNTARASRSISEVTKQQLVVAKQSKCFCLSYYGHRVQTQWLYFFLPRITLSPPIYL